MRIRIPKAPSLALLSAVLWVACSLALAGAQTSDEAKSPSGNSAETHLGKGYDALKQDRYDEAIQEFRAALEIDPTLVLRARFPLAVALFEAHKNEEARREFETVQHEEGDHPNICYYLGRLDLESLDFHGAIRNLKKAIAKPPFPDTAYYLGYAYFKDGDLPNAEKWLTEAERQNPRDARIPYQLGFVYRKQGEADKAKKAMARSQQLRQRDTNESQIKTECEEKLEHGDRETAHAICNQLYDPDNADKLTTLGTIYGQHGDLQAALKPLLRAAEIEPQAPQMQYNLALTYFQLNQFENARKPLEPAIKRWPDLFPLNSLYGAVLMKLGDLDAAYTALQHARWLNPDDGPTLQMLYATTYDLGQRDQHARRYSEALRYFAEAAALRPDQAAPHKRMAETYTLTGRAVDAKSEQEKADQLSKTGSAN
jgi:tetratricopeptide (TPR) repeat protein